MKLAVLVTMTSILATSVVQAREVQADLSDAQRDNEEKAELRGLVPGSGGGIKKFYKRLVCGTGWELRESIYGYGIKAHCRKQQAQYYPLECPTNYSLVIMEDLYVCAYQQGNELMIENPVCNQEGFVTLLNAYSKFGGQCFNQFSYKAPSLYYTNQMNMMNAEEK